MKLQVVEEGSGAKAGIGSGFRLGGGRIATNYHVIAQLVQHPGRYRAEIVTEGEAPGLGALGLEADAGGTPAAPPGEPVELLAIDAVHDLAIVRAASEGPHLRLAAAEPARGSRLYAFGFPHDLGLSVVEGTHNGRLDHSLYPKLHFTGAINAGMSGGPTILGSGEVIGINVASAGNAVGFLVPVGRLAALLSRLAEPGFAPPTPEGFLDEVRDQVRESQRAQLAALEAGPLATTTLGRFEVPSELSDSFHCWGDARRSPSEPYELVFHQCSTQDYIHLSGSHRSGVIRLRHRLVSSEELSAPRFARLYQAQYADAEWLSGSEEDVTPFRCQTDTVAIEGRALRTALCLRTYKRLRGLYDVVLKSAALGVPGEGLVSTLTLSGVGAEEGLALAHRFLEAIQWTP